LDVTGRLVRDGGVAHVLDTVFLVVHGIVKAVQDPELVVIPLASFEVHSQEACMTGHLLRATFSTHHVPQAGRIYVGAVMKLNAG